MCQVSAWLGAIICAGRSCYYPASGVWVGRGRLPASASTGLCTWDFSYNMRRKDGDQEWRTEALKCNGRHTMTMQVELHLPLPPRRMGRPVVSSRLSTLDSRQQHHHKRYLAIRVNTRSAFPSPFVSCQSLVAFPSASEHGACTTYRLSADAPHVSVSAAVVHP
jgi:hypothetical protein